MNIWYAELPKDKRPKQTEIIDPYFCGKFEGFPDMAPTMYGCFFSPEEAAQFIADNNLEGFEVVKA